MDPHVVLAEHYMRSSLPDDLAHSALPDAPVQPYAPKRQTLRRWLTRLRTPTAAIAEHRPTEAGPAECPVA